ncbi:hypothetical protein PROFUN_01946 [Planoprotostelium fungivorum]|uniref:Uncharacterized protein n=1 Tax=Planoprotostelium fungivorum TaxID=1890364 RepID=A0A2P6NAX8_9EUKA|nr:hypothetical protein PROFUN_01946 [Planoprotostelium fungivorum]
MAYIRENITSTPDYTLETGDKPITENTREHIRRIMNNLSTEDWRRRQKVWSAFFTHHADQRSLPRKKEPYSNLITKIMTGTIWTNKRKKQYNLTEDDSCKFCSDIMDESILDSHQHVLGECILTRELNDQLWANLKQFWDKSKIQTENILPWFSTSDYDQYEWNLPEEMGNKGLIPRNLRRKISKENKGLNNNPKAYHQCIPVSTGIDGNISNTLTKYHHQTEQSNKHTALILSLKI